MTSRLVRLALLASLLVVTSMYVVSGFHLRAVRYGGQVSRTSAPSNSHDDGVWQSARQIATTSGSSFRIGKHDLRTAALAPPHALTAVRSRLSDVLGSASRDRSPQHSIPLLI